MDYTFGAWTIAGICAAITEETLLRGPLLLQFKSLMNNLGGGLVSAVLAKMGTAGLFTATLTRQIFTLVMNGAERQCIFSRIFWFLAGFFR
jgi:hypothetical protein